MADEQKTAEVDTPTTENNEVVISQSKLDKLIDKGFSKGANRAKSELAEQLGVDSIEQAQELINAKREADEANKSDLDKAAELIQTLQGTITSNYSLIWLFSKLLRKTVSKMLIISNIYYHKQVVVRTLTNQHLLNN